MINRALILYLTGLVCLASLPSCKNSGGEDEKIVRTVVPVMAVSPRIGKMAEYTELLATSAFLVKAVIKSPVTGYVEKCSFSPGDKAQKNQVLFQLRTREAEAMQQENAGSINISGVVLMKATLDGVVATIDHPQGDYVQEGDVLGTLVVPESLVFLLEVPYRMKKMVTASHDYKLILPDNTEITASVRSVMPSMSAASQTQRVALQPRSFIDIPENLTAKVNIALAVRNNAVILPKSCILNDEIMKNFWIMKLINDSVAVKIPVETGIKTTDSIEVVTPVFDSADRILSSGNYGLGDTVMVRIIKHD
ncbi:MAG: HlyD family efflux transporter periplasmic adaptor subunit [Bacteroidota bacterium]